MAKALLVWWYLIIALASVANPMIAIFQLASGNLGGAAMFAGLSIASWVVARNTLQDARKGGGWG